ncbi:MAG: TlpA family protein disulfide reductase [Vulcanimicrobiaceae bacterium]
MNRRTLWIVAVVVAALAVLVLLPLFRPGAIRQAGPAGLVGQPAPVFALHDDRGNPASLAAYRGKVVLLNLWASWCPPCRAEMPDLQRLQSAYASRGLVVIGVNQGESPQRAADFAKALQIDFPIWIDDQQQYGRVFAALGLPTTVIIGPDGIVRRGFDGALTLDQMRAAVAPLLGGA